MLTLEIPNFKSSNILESAKVARDVLKGQTTFQIDNPQNFHAYDYILLGKIGGSVSGLMQIIEIVDNTVTLNDVIGFNVERGTAVTRLAGNKIKIYTAPFVQGANPTIGNFTPLSGGLIDIDPDQETTEFTDPNGSDQLWYRYTYYNSYTTTESSLDDSDDSRDVTDSEYTTVDAIRHEAGFDSNTNVTDELIERKRQAAQSRIDGMLAGKYTLPFTHPIHPQIADLSTRLAAGLVMIAEYGTYDGTDKTKGEKLRDDAIKELMAYQSGAEVIVGLEGIDETLPDGGGFSSSFGSQESDAMFSTNDITGYSNRIY